MKIGLLLFFLYTTSAAFSALPVDFVINQDEKINKKDQKGKKQGKWVYYGKDRPSEGYPNNAKIEEGTYKDDRKEGVWIRYYEDGVTPKIKGEYKNNRPEGSYVKHSPKGIVIEKGVFAQGKYTDSLIRYHENGQVEYQAFYNETGAEQGTVKYFYANGQLEYEYKTENGKPQGEAKRYYENGDVKEVISYDANGRITKSEQKEMVSTPVKVKDPEVSKEKAPKVAQPRTKGAKFQPNGYNKVYNDNDEIWQDGEFKNGILWSGKVYEYDRDGILLKVKVYKEGVYHSDGQL